MKGLTHVLVACMLLMLASCVTQKKYVILQTQMSKATEDLRAANEQRDLCTSRLNNCQSDLSVANNKLASKDEQLSLLKDQLNDCKTTRDKQLTQVGDLTVLSKGANDNISQTLAQLQDKDRYIQLLQAAKTKADSINLALAINLKGVLKDGLDDKDVDIKVDKTVVYINLSDKMLYDKGSYTITLRAKDVLGKIAAIVSSRPEVDVMVEGYTDNTPISTSCLEDNWDLSVKEQPA